MVNLLFKKGVDMKNIIFSLVLGLVCSACFAGDCSSGTCKIARTPVRTVVSTVGNAAVAVVKAPVRVVQNRVDNVRTRRYNRRCK
jgi:hypothetical protein